MSTTTLNARFAAILAQDAYRLKNDLTRRIVLAEHKDRFEVEEELKGKTGAFIVLKSSHIMGACAFGIKEYENQAFVMLKGTASGFDALTDLNAGITRSATGGQVHQGFQYTFESFLPQLKVFQAQLAKRHGVQVVHCIGHSLGGALATLAADWLEANTSTPVKLYTFGSPRVGFPYFASDITNRVTPENIYRVYHKTDPVPMVPTWPFTHVPEMGTDYLMNSGLALLPWEYHKMENYIKSVSDNSSSGLDWPTLHALRPPELLEKSVENWLKSDGPVSLCLNTARVLDAALIWVVKKIIQAGVTVLVGVGTTTFTILDRLAYMMHKAYNFAKDLGYWVMRLITRIARALGIVVTETTTLSISFIRMIFTRMHHSISELVRKASQVVN
jgi:hypothetical protein